jgi:hypothetical protein
MNKRALPLFAVICCLATFSLAAAQRVQSGNPILEGWYADPEAHVFDDQYWIFPTYSAPYNEQTFMDAFSSRNLITWKKHPRVLDTANVKWAHRALWAPSIIERDGWYYIFFGANAIQNDSTIGGVGVARARAPDGPFIDYLGKPLINKFNNGAQPIDQMVFKDKDDKYYIIYGSSGHCNIARLNDSFTGFIPLADGKTFKEITPSGYVEGAFMFMKDNKYYLMWSEGDWAGPDYAVAYAIGTTPFGPFGRLGIILQQDSSIATSTGHNSVLHEPGSPKYYIVYHRRPLGETDPNHRVVSIDEMRFDERGFIQPVAITKTGVGADSLHTSRRGRSLSPRHSEGTQDYASMAPLPVGAGCQDGVGSTGRVVAPASPLQKDTSTLCRFDRGPRTGQTQDYAPMAPLSVDTDDQDDAGGMGRVVAPGSPSQKDKSTLCLFDRGPRAGQTQDYKPMAPLPVGTGCQDGTGSTGRVVAPGSPSRKDTSTLCRFDRGPRAGQTQDYAPMTPLPVGRGCQDGAGSTGWVVAPGSPSQKDTSTLCRFDRGPRAGQTQDYAPMTPLPVGGSCQDGAGSTGQVVVSSAPLGKNF